MASTTHEHFVKSIDRDIERQIAKLSQDFPLAFEFCENLRVSAPIIKLDDKSYRVPDIQVSHRAAEFPTIVLEIGHSQQRSSLEKAAQRWMCSTRGSVQKVIGISTGFNVEEATVNIWELDNDHVMAQHSVQSEVSKSLQYQRIID